MVSGVREFAPPIVEGAFGRTEKVDPYLELGLPFMSHRSGAAHATPTFAQRPVRHSLPSLG